MTLSTALVAITVLAVAALLWSEAREHPMRRGAKMVASTGFVAIALDAGALDSPYGRFVLVALVLSWLGDLFLTFPQRRLFLAGLGAFLATHLAYTAGFLVRGIAATAAAFVAAGVALSSALLVWRWLRPHLDTRMRVPIIAYIAAITVMVTAAFASVAAGWDPRIAAGAAAFFASDVAVARNRFVAPGYANRAWGLPLYYLAQVTLALSIGG